VRVVLSMTSTGEWHQKYNQLSRGGATIETGLYNRDGEFTQESAAFARNRENTLYLVRKRLLGFKTGLKNIDNRLKSVREQNKRGQYDPVDLQKYLESFESKLTAYKSSMRAEYDALQHEENVLEDSITHMMGKIEEWEGDETSGNKSLAAGAAREQQAKAQRARTQDRYEKHMELQGKIGAIDRQMANLGGMHGGWDARDHDAFVRAWVQSTSVTQVTLNESQRRVLRKRLVANVPVKTEEEFDDHIDWYMTHLKLTSEKKELLELWKASKKVEQTRKYKSSFEEELDVQEEEHQRQNRVTSVFVSAEDREAAKVRIASWKKEKEAEARRKQAAENEAKILELQKVEDDKRKRQALQRAKLESWKKEEEVTKQNDSKAEKLPSASARVVAAQLEDRQQRDRELTQMQLARKEKAQERVMLRETKVREMAKALKSEGSTVLEAKKDSARLRAGTKTFNQHKFETESIVEAQRRRESTSAHSSVMPGHGRDLHGVGRSPAAWLNRK
jgi:hypothetical protein